MNIFVLKLMTRKIEFSFSDPHEIFPLFLTAQLLYLDSYFMNSNDCPCNNQLAILTMETHDQMCNNIKIQSILALSLA